MNITITVYYNVGANLIKAQHMQDSLNKAAEVAGLKPNEENGSHILSHSYFHETYLTTKRKANKFADKIRKMEGVDNVTVNIKD